MGLEWIVAFLVLGLVVGFMAGLLGIGGGGIMVPVLTSIFLAQGVPVEQVVHMALGTSMASIVFTSFASMRAHHKKGAVMWNVVKVMAVCIIGHCGTLLAPNENRFSSLSVCYFMAYVSIHMAMIKNQNQAENSQLLCHYLVLVLSLALSLRLSLSVEAL